MLKEEYIVYPSKKKTIGLSFLSIIFVISGIFFVAIAPSTESEKTLLIVIGVITIIFFGLCLAYLLNRLFIKKPSIIINESGLFEQSSYIGAGHVRWEEIKDFYIYEYMNQKMLGIELKDPNQIIDRTKGFKKLLIKANTGLVSAQISIPQNTISVPLEDIEAKLNEFLYVANK